MNLTSSHGRGCDRNAVIYSQSQQRLVPYHNLQHQDCLVRPQPAPLHMDSFMENSQKYIELKYPDLFTLSFPGLNKYKIEHDSPIPSGVFQDYSVRQALQSFTKSKICSLIFGSNDFKWITSKSAEDAVKDYFKLLSFLFNGTAFKTVFVSTIFPRRSFYCNGVINPLFKHFNDELLSSGNRFIKISNPMGEETSLNIRIINMTNVFKYEEMDNPKFYCGRSRDGTHINGFYFENYLSQLFLSIQLHSKSKSKKSKALRRKGVAGN